MLTSVDAVLASAGFAVLVSAGFAVLALAGFAGNG
jgi:hypothetical protein